jgi:hypothetical protein
MTSADAFELETQSGSSLVIACFRNQVLMKHEQQVLIRDPNITRGSYSALQPRDSSTRLTGQDTHRYIRGAGGDRARSGRKDTRPCARSSSGGSWGGVHTSVSAKHQGEVGKCRASGQQQTTAQDIIRGRDGGGYRRGGGTTAGTIHNTASRGAVGWPLDSGEWEKRAGAAP